MPGFDSKDGREHKVGYHGKWRATLRTLRSIAEGWRLSRSTELERRVTRDGVLIDQWPMINENPLQQWMPERHSKATGSALLPSVGLGGLGFRGLLELVIGGFFGGGSLSGGLGRLGSGCDCL